MAKEPRNVAHISTKTTFYVDDRNLAALERERLNRIEAGVARSQCDLSDLVNEAIRVHFKVKAIYTTSRDRDLADAVSARGRKL